MYSLPTSFAMLRTAALAGLAVCLLAACQRQPPAEPAVATPESAAVTTPETAAVPATDPGETLPTGVLRAYVWTCADGQTLVMRNLFREKAVAIDFHDGTRRLDQTVSASGAKYADAVVTFWTKGSTATLERQGTAPVQCEERRADSLREDARVRGVVYRALGNEPGWVLEIGPGAGIVFVTNFGSETHTFDAAQESAGADGASRTFTAGSGEQAIRATVLQERCVDDGGVEFDHSATVEFAGQALRGCGTRLNAG
jgi:membrane-bound inhibitor of C-type lysozyme